MERRRSSHRIRQFDCRTRLIRIEYFQWAPLVGPTEKMDKKRNNLSRFLYYGARWILGGVFIYASYDKILHPAAFSKIIYNYQILPDGLINLTALVLPMLELIMGIFFWVGFWMPGTVMLSNILLVSYIGALILNLARGLDINCGCFSMSSGSSINIESILWDAAFLALSVYLTVAVFGSENGRELKQIHG